MSGYDTIPGSGAAGDPEGGGNASRSIAQRVRSWVPDTVNVDMFDPSTSQSLSDRLQLIYTYCASWRDFFDLSEFNIPLISELKERLNHNVGRFFYNYFFIGCAFLVLYAIFQFWSVIILLAYISVGYLLYYKFEDDIKINDSITINKTVKNVIMVVGAIVAFMFGNLHILIMSIAFFMFCIVGVHASIREHES